MNATNIESNMMLEKINKIRFIIVEFNVLLKIAATLFVWLTPCQLGLNRSNDRQYFLLMVVSISKECLRPLVHKIQLNPRIWRRSRPKTGLNETAYRETHASSF